jgi:glycosyltransferase involved in cell wall biosynthesis
MIHKEMRSALLMPTREAVGLGRRIRILFVITALQTGGAEMMLYKLLAGMDRGRFDPSVICLGRCGTPGVRIKSLGIPVHIAELSPTRPSLRSLWRVFKWVRDLRPDLIQGWMYHGNAVASFAQFLSVRSVPVLWSIRHTVYRLTDEKASTAKLIRLSALASRRVLRIIYASRASAERHEAMGFAPERTVLIPNGFDCDLFKPSTDARAAIRKQLNAGEDAILIGRIGRFHPMKDHASFFQAAGMISEMNRAIQFVLAGEGIDWKNPVIVDLVNRFRLNDRVHLLGERDDIPDLTAALDIATSSSFSESYPNVIGEAMACGVPCVVTDVGHSAAIVGDAGLVVPPRDPTALAAAWLPLVEAGTAARAKLGAVARHRILSNFSLDQIVRQYEALYDEALQNKVLEA